VIDEPPQRIGILLTRGPETADARIALDLAAAAARRGHRVDLFLMAEGVDLLDGDGAVRLERDGIRPAVCTQSVLDRRGPKGLGFVDYAGQAVLARMVARADRFVAFS